MNRAYKLVWSSISGSWVVASELAKGAKKSSVKKSSGKTLKLAVLLAGSLASGVAAAAPAANTLPTGESVLVGSATFDRSTPDQLTINQSDTLGYTTWQNFDVGRDAKVVINQPDSNSYSFNSVTSGVASQIFGKVETNGQFILSNAAGMTFGTGSQVNAAAIVATANPGSFVTDGQYAVGAPTAGATVINYGTLTAIAGDVTLLAPRVINAGAISAAGGNVNLMNANKVTFNNSVPGITVNAISTGFIQNSGSITATQVSSVGGKILLTGDTSQSGSQIQLAGTLDASTNTNVNGRSILVNGDVNLNGASNALDFTATDGYSLSNAAVVNLNGASSGFSVNGSAYTVIRDVNQLQAMSNDITGDYVLGGNIDASDTVNWNGGAGFSPVGVSGNPFIGVLDGLGHRIDQLHINRPGSSSVGLFGQAAGVVIQNLGLSNVNVSGGFVSAPLIGRLTNNYTNITRIRNVYSTGTYTVGNGNFQAGLVGAISAFGGSEAFEFSNLYSSVNMVASTGGGAYIGGLIGGMTAPSLGTDPIVSIRDAYFSGSIVNSAQSLSYVGGIIGSTANSMNVLLDRVYVSGAIAGSAGSTGAIAGSVQAGLTVKNSYWNRDSSGQASAVAAGGFTLDQVSGLSDAESRQLASYATWSSAIDAQGGTGSTWRIYDGVSGPLLRSYLKPLTATVADSSKTYDGSTSASSSYSLSDAAASMLGTASYISASRHVGEHALTLGGVYSGQQGYDLQVIDGRVTIGKASLVISSTDARKTYDGSTAGSASAIAAAGTQLFGTDSLSGGTFSYDNKNAGTGKTMTVSGVTVDDGNGGNNYDFSYAANSNSTIDKASLLVSSTDAQKTYDGSTAGNATAVVAAGSQLYGTDSLSGGTFTYDNKHAGTGKTLTVSGVTVNDGNGGNNYELAYVANTGSSIAKADLQVTAADVRRNYDGTLAAVGQAVAAAGSQLYGSDSLGGGSFAFTDKNAGTAKTVTVSGVTVNDGNGGNNYNVSYVDNHSSVIDPAILALQLAAVSKVYDGTTDATTSLSLLAGSRLYGSDSMSGGKFRFMDKNVGTNKQLVLEQNVSIADGNNGNNYIVAYVPSLNSSISKASLVLSSGDVSKTYDGSTSASGTLHINSGQLFGSDSLSGGLFSFADKNAGSAKTVSLSGVTVHDGNNSGNYDVTYVDNTTSTINKRLLTISAVADSKEYDGKLTSSVTAKPVVVGRQRGDSIVGLTQSFANKNAGIGKTINVDAGYTIRDGNNGNNYDVVLVNNTSGVITPKALTISTVANTKVYDGGVTSANKPVVTGLALGDSVTGLFQQYESKTVGTNKKMLIKTGYVLRDGNGGNNYTVTEVGSMDGIITAPVN